jgi:polyisoprenyl-teichoic acid--peptidoglycan teichoic acid transferase
MLDTHNNRSKRRPVSIDGFRPNSGNLQPNIRTAQSQLGGDSGRVDGFRPQNQIEKQTVAAFERKATLPAPSLLSNHLGAKEKKPRSKFRRTLKAVGVSSGALFLCGLIVGGVVFGKAWLTASNIFKGGGSSSTLFSTDVKPEQLKGEGDGRVNVLLVGIGGGNRDGANLTDTIMIASIDPVAKDIALLSIPRDLYVKVPGFWSMKINAAYSSAMEQAYQEDATDEEAREAGFTTLEEVIETYIGVPVHYHALVNFQAFREGVDAVGGIDVNVEEDLYDYVIAPDNGGSPLIAKAGLQHFDGKTALLYSQSRYTTSDFARGERQRQVIIALKEKVLSAGTFSNPKAISDLLDALGDNVTINASLGELMRMYEITKEIPSSAIATVGFTDEGNVLVMTDSINDQSIVRPKTGLTNFSEIQSFVRNTLRDPFLKSENATIAVLNGTTTPGLATLKADELKSYGYNVTIIDDAPTKDYQSTVIYDKTNGVKKFTKSYLERRLNADSAEEPVSSNPILVTADFIVVLGANETSTTTN